MVKVNGWGFCLKEASDRLETVVLRQRDVLDVIRTFPATNLMHMSPMPRLEPVLQYWMDVVQL
jgi:hypothetical protein